MSRLARLAFDGAEGEALTTIGPVEIVASDEVDADQARERVGERREALRAEVARAEGKLANAAFVKKAPVDVVESERRKLAHYRAELEELERQ